MLRVFPFPTPKRPILASFRLISAPDLEVLGLRADVISYNSMIHALGLAHQWPRALHLLHRLGPRGDRFSCCAALGACGEALLWEKAGVFKHFSMVSRGFTMAFKVFCLVFHAFSIVFSMVFNGL